MEGNCQLASQAVRAGARSFSSGCGGHHGIGLGVNLAGLNLFGLIRMLLFVHRRPIRLASIEVCTASKEGGNPLIEDTEA